MSSRQSEELLAVAEEGERQYELVCHGCGRALDDDGLRLKCPGEHAPAFLGTRYRRSRLEVCENSEGIYRYRRWLPVVRTVPGAGGTVSYRSEGLARELGLRDLWIAFNGFWPERGAALRTGTFKELEAYTVFGRLPENPPPLVVPSVGNTAAAFASVFSRAEVDCLLVVPDSGLHRFASIPDAVGSHVRLVSITGGSYGDAIDLADRVSNLPGFQAVGGAWNVARRDGLATVLLSAVEAMGGMPEVYFQAVGSAVGAIAVDEAATRLLDSGQYGTKRPRLVMCQNAEAAPVHDLWRAELDGTEPGTCPRTPVHADELVNRRPPYAVPGGIRGALRDSGGEVLLSDAAEAKDAAELFHRAEGIDVEPAASVAVACLRRAAEQGRISPGTRVLLNITGGGRARLAAEAETGRVTPDLCVDTAELGAAGLPERIAELFSRRFESARN